MFGLLMWIALEQQLLSLETAQTWSMPWIAWTAQTSRIHSMNPELKCARTVVVAAHDLVDAVVVALLLALVQEAIVEAPETESDLKVATQGMAGTQEIARTLEIVLMAPRIVANLGIDDLVIAVPQRAGIHQNAVNPQHETVLEAEALSVMEAQVLEEIVPRMRISVCV